MYPISEECRWALSGDHVSGYAVCSMMLSHPNMVVPRYASGNAHHVASLESLMHVIEYKKKGCVSKSGGNEFQMRLPEMRTSLPMALPFFKALASMISRIQSMRSSRDSTAKWWLFFPSEKICRLLSVGMRENA